MNYNNEKNTTTSTNMIRDHENIRNGVISNNKKNTPVKNSFKFQPLTTTQHPNS
jgi:hypothetical protein